MVIWGTAVYEWLFGFPAGRTGIIIPGRIQKLQVAQSCSSAGSGITQFQDELRRVRGLQPPGTPNPNYVVLVGPQSR